MRPLGIPAVKDRIVQTAVKLVHRADLRARVSARRVTAFGRDVAAKMRLREVDRLLKEGYTYVVDADLQGYFDTHSARSADGAGARSGSAMDACLTLIEGFSPGRTSWTGHGAVDADSGNARKGR